MKQRSGSSTKKVSETKLKESQVDPDFLLTLLHDDVTNAKNSVGSIDPLLLERLSENTRGAIKKTSRKKSTPTEKITENPTATIKTEVTKAKKQTTLDSYLLGDKTLNKDDVILTVRKRRQIRKNTVKPPVAKVVSTTTRKSPASTKTTKNEERKRNGISNRAKKIDTNIQIDGQRKITDYPLVCEQPLALKETPIKSTPNKVKSSGAKKKTTLVSYKSLPAKSILETKKYEKSPAARKLRSSRKHEKSTSGSVTDFSIEDIAWYYEDEDHYREKCKKLMEDFDTDNNRHKLFYTYFLLDSRKCKNKENISWLDFIQAIFYIGKGKDQRAFKHTKDTEKWLSDDKKVIDKRRHKRYLKIKEIWDSGNPVKVFLVTEDITKEEALTREAAMIESMGMKRLCNLRNGTYHGFIAAIDLAIRRMEIGAALLVEAMEIFRKKNVLDVDPKIKLDIVRSERLNVICDNDDSNDNDKYSEYNFL